MFCFDSVALVVLWFTHVMSAAQAIENSPDVPPTSANPAVATPVTGASPMTASPGVTGAAPPGNPQSPISPPADRPVQPAGSTVKSGAAQVAPLPFKATVVEILVGEGGSLLRFHCEAPRGQKLAIAVGENSSSEGVFESFRADQSGVERSMDMENRVLTLWHSQDDLNAFVMVRLDQMIGTTVYEIHEESQAVRMTLTLVNGTGQTFEFAETISLTANGRSVPLKNFSIGMPSAVAPTAVDIVLESFPLADKVVGYWIADDEFDAPVHKPASGIAKFRFLSAKWPKPFSQALPIRVTRGGRSYDPPATALASSFAQAKSGRFIELQAEGIPTVRIDRAVAYTNFRRTSTDRGIYQWQVDWQDRIVRVPGGVDETVHVLYPKAVYENHPDEPQPLTLPRGALIVSGPPRGLGPETIRLLVTEIGRVNAPGVQGKLQQVNRALEFAIAAQSDEEGRLKQISEEMTSLKAELEEIESKRVSLLKEVVDADSPHADSRSLLEGFEFQAQDNIRQWNARWN